MGWRGRNFGFRISDLGFKIRNSQFTIRNSKSLFCLFCLLGTLAFPSPLHPQGRIVFGVVPFQSPSKSARMFMPLADYLSEKTVLKVDFVVAPDFKVYQERMERGEYDITFSNPFQYIVANSKAGYIAFAKVAREPFTGIILVRRDSGIKGVEELRGKTIAFAYPTAWAAAVQTRKWLEVNYGIDYYRDMKPRFVGSHDSAILAVFTRVTDAAGAIPHEFRTMNEKVKRELVVIGETTPHPQMPFAHHPRLDKGIVEKIKRTLLALDRSTPEGRKILDALEREGFEEADDKEYDIVRALADEYSKNGMPYAREFRWK
ncbi:MAG: phosphate/phosphite/phosphonate ABC transporter substrate-binding protein [Deltaproteobacteria bacterium]|nr:phosphate/phosphite/phosphonate ABC transporter substrate-binding protein [Deltaproteobacteria bacterium]